MCDLYLEFASKAREKDAKAYLREFIDSGSEINGMGDLDEYEDYDKWLAITQDYSKGMNLPENYVPSSEFFLIRKKDDRIVGMTNIRHGLNDYLNEHGYGNIGYGIRPGERRKGYAVKILQLALEKCKQLGIEQVHVGCDEHNIGSKKVIEKNGGVFYQKLNNDGEPYLEYVIHI